uniref:uncharacterized protein LOC100175267 isoform X3 n=1 Tax=Ciona intestinalis TaxID=7719 RepID=UPI000521B2FC|nr:uncharacterized protein LOC100175267 isoform X3 [Ciona intestinalis]|eukprot:XP_026691251.1 uncharacterized protein LOC100175267 isoform X3 [Ciona intestinalis]
MKQPKPNLNDPREQRFDERQAFEIRYLSEKMEKLEQENEGLKKKVADRDAVIQALKIKHQKMWYQNNETMEVQGECESRLLQVILGTEQQTYPDENVYVQIQDTKYDTRVTNISPTTSSRETEIEADRHARPPTVSSPAAPEAVLTEERSLQMADGDQNPSTLPGPVESLGNHHRQIQPANGDFASSIVNMSSEMEFRALSFSDFPNSNTSLDESSGLRKKVVRAWRKTLNKGSYDI